MKLTIYSARWVKDDEFLKRAVETLNVGGDSAEYVDGQTIEGTARADADGVMLYPAIVTRLHDGTVSQVINGDAKVKEAVNNLIKTIDVK